MKFLFCFKNSTTSLSEFNDFGLLAFPVKINFFHVLENCCVDFLRYVFKNSLWIWLFFFCNTNDTFTPDSVLVFPENNLFNSKELILDNEPSFEMMSMHSLYAEKVHKKIMIKIIRYLISLIMIKRKQKV